MKTFLALTGVWLWLAFGGVGHAQGTTTLTFDEFTLPLPGEVIPVPNGYGSLQWNNFYVLNSSNARSPSGFQNALVSPDNFISNGSGDSAQVNSADPFDLNSAYMTADWMDGLQVEAQGFVGSTLRYTNVYTINTGGPTLVAFNYYGINQVSFIAFGGTQNPLYSGSGSEFAIDNMTVTVPEPSRISLLLLGLACTSLFSQLSRDRA